jgi:hypothetical protein
MKYIPPYILDKIERRQRRDREQLRQRLPLPQSLPFPLQNKPKIKEEKEDVIIIDMGG